jgi:hypothetical protein
MNHSQPQGCSLSGVVPRTALCSRPAKNRFPEGPVSQKTLSLCGATFRKRGFTALYSGVAVGITLSEYELPVLGVEPIDTSHMRAVRESRKFPSGICEAEHVARDGIFLLLVCARRQRTAQPRRVRRFRPCSSLRIRGVGSPPLNWHERLRAACRKQDRCRQPNKTAASQRKILGIFAIGIRVRNKRIGCSLPASRRLRRGYRIARIRPVRTPNFSTAVCLDGCTFSISANVAQSAAFLSINGGSSWFDAIRSYTTPSSSTSTTLATWTSPSLKHKSTILSVFSRSALTIVSRVIFFVPQLEYTYRSREVAFAESERRPERCFNPGQFLRNPRTPNSQPG